MKRPLSAHTRPTARFGLSITRLLTAAWMAAALAAPSALQAQVNVLTNRYDAQRTGANLRETKLTTANVNVGRFGRLYSYPVDGSVYAQPLYVTGVTINGSARNVLYVATMSDKVYAFDADRPSASPLWTRDFTAPPSVTPVPVTDIVGPGLNIIGNVGIQSTPVIDPATQTLYLVARTKENGAYVQRLHALDITSGQERTGSPLKITGSVPGAAPDAVATASGSVIRFDPKVQMQRAGLALTNGVVLVAWAAHEDAIPSHGWLMGFDATTLARVGIFAVAPDAYLGSIWQAGRAPAIDATGHAYVATANGKWDGVRNFGDSVLKFAVSRSGLSLVDYFTPDNEAQLDLADDDLGASGFTLLPGTNLLLGGGKEGVLYLLNGDNLGRRVSNDTQIVQKIAVTGGHVMGGPVCWNSASIGPLVYNWSEDDALKAYRFSGSRLTTPPYAQGDIVSPGHPGGSLTVSANGSLSRTGIVWASMPTSQNAKHGLAAGILRAFNAETLQEIWSSEQEATRDRVGTLMKFVPPVVANGKVYLPNHDGAVAVYGLLPSDFAIGASPARQVLAPGNTTTFSVTIGAQGGFTQLVMLTASGQASGTTVSFNPPAVTGGGVATMTVAVPANSAATSFQIIVTGTSGSRVHSAAPVAVSVVTAAPGVGAIGVNFLGSSTAAMSAAETAGVVSAANWNNAAGAARSTPMPLVDQTGASTGATVTWASNNTWMTPIADQAGSARMMKGYLDTTSASATTVTVAGLLPRTYDVYLYADGDNRTYDRTAAYTISGAGIAATTITLTDRANTNFSGSFMAAGSANYVTFTIAAGGFTLTATPAAPLSGTRRAPINGVQIVPVSTPAPAGPIGINFVGSSATAMGAAETAGVVAAPNWNNAVGATRTTPLALADDTGAATGATVTWASTNTWMTPITDQAGNRRMMKGYLDTTSTSATTVTVAGLAPRAYDVYVYVDGDNRSYERIAAYTISGTGTPAATVMLTDVANTNFSGTFTGTFTRASNAVGNYVKFSITGSGFTVTAKPVSGGNATLRAPINGLQIVPR